MTCCTYLTESDYTAPVKNEHLADLMEMLRKHSPKEWRLHEFEYTTGRLWWKKTLRRYQLFMNTHSVEFQVINFYKEEGDALPAPVTSEHISAYIYGMLGGISLIK